MYLMALYMSLNISMALVTDYAPGTFCTAPTGQSLLSRTWMKSSENPFHFHVIYLAADGKLGKHATFDKKESKLIFKNSFES